MLFRECERHELVARFGAELAAADEDQAAGRHDRATKVFSAGLRYAPGFEFRKFPEWDLPKNFALVQVNGIELTPGRFDRWIATFIKESKVAGSPIRFAGGFSLKYQAQNIRLLIRVDVQNAGLGIETRPTPRRPAVEPGHDNRAVRGWWQERRAPAIAPEKFQGLFMGFGRDL